MSNLLKEQVAVAMQEAQDGGFVFNEATIEQMADAMCDEERFKYNNPSQLIPHIEMWLTCKGLL